MIKKSWESNFQIPFFLMRKRGVNYLLFREKETKLPQGAISLEEQLPLGNKFTNV
jgi:hypothetical protein